MSHHHLSHDAYKIMPWKNGFGSTQQIRIFPEDAIFPGEDFLWRVSSARVHTSSPFSFFPGCDRILTILKGEGLLLNGKQLSPYESIAFSGDEFIHCDLLGKEVQDIGVIYRRDRIRAHSVCLELHHQAEISLNPANVALFFVASGSVKVGELLLKEGDSLVVENESSVRFVTDIQESAKLIQFCIETL